MTGRADRIAARVAEGGLDALLITRLPNLRWATGFTGSNGAAIIGPAVRLFITDFRYTEQSRVQVNGFDHASAGSDLLLSVAEHLHGAVGFEDQWLSVHSHGRLLDAVPYGTELVRAGGIVEHLREVKDEAEVAAMRAAAELADQAYVELAEQGIGGRTERQVAADLEARMRRIGAESASFPTIVASGSQAARPHAEPRDTGIEPESLVIIDMGCVVDGYCSDCTRTFAVGRPGDEALAVYDLVAMAQRAAVAAVRAGAECAAVDAVARDLIAEAGYRDNFGHGLGHGVGLEVHEGPRLAASARGALTTGNAVTVEPGVYLPGRLGVRIEDLVIVRDGQPETLTGFERGLVTLSP